MKEINISGEKSKYLEEDKDLLDELDSIGPLSTGAALEEQKAKIEALQIKALLRSRKAAQDTEESNERSGNVILVFAAVQVVLAIFQFGFSVITSVKNSLEQWIGIILLFIGVGFMYVLFRKVKINK